MWCDGRLSIGGQSLATIRGADRIIVLQNGEIIESGSHDQLMARRGVYARLYNMNYASFDDIIRDDGDGRPRRQGDVRGVAGQAVPKLSASRQDLLLEFAHR